MKKAFLIGGIVLVIISTLLILTGCGSKSIVGSWAGKDASSYVYKFNKDKTGSYTAFKVETPFTYEDDGKTVSILYSGSSTPLLLDYKIEGKELTIKDSFGSDIVYVKK